MEARMSKAWSPKEIDSVISDISKINGEDAHEFRGWYVDLRNRNRGIIQSIITDTCNLNLSGFLGNQDDSHFYLAMDVFHNAWFATKFQNSDDYYEMKLCHEASSIKRDEILDAAKKLRRNVGYIPSMLLSAVTPKNESPSNPYDYWGSSLDKMISSLEASKKHKPKHEFEYFGLQYFNIGQHKNRPNIKTILLYKLEFIFRAYTSESSDGIYEGKSMPKDGKPCRRLTALIANTVFPNGTLVDEPYIKQQVKQMTTNPNLVVQWGFWPSETIYTKR